MARRWPLSCPTCIACGADALVRAGGPRPALLSNQALLAVEKPARGPAADEGVRPTIYLAVLCASGTARFEHSCPAQIASVHIGVTFRLCRFSPTKPPPFN